MARLMWPSSRRDGVAIGAIFNPRTVMQKGSLSLWESTLPRAMNSSGAIPNWRRKAPGRARRGCLETVVAGFDGGMGGEDGHGGGHFLHIAEGLAVAFHELAGQFQHGKGAVALVEMNDAGPDAQAQQARRPPMPRMASWRRRMLRSPP